MLAFVFIVPKPGSWSKVGTDAMMSEVTMQLGLIRGRNDFNQHIVRHEFGHALGLEHEHQRSKFWRIAEKFLDIDTMKDDSRLKNTDLKRDYLEKLPTEGSKGSENYDPESIMHYW